GGLTRLAAPADVHALILSDVLGDDLSAIASGPTVPDPTTYAEAVAILNSNKLWQNLPAAVQTHLQQGLLGHIPETPKADDPIFTHSGYTLIGSNTVSLHAVAKAAQNLGYATKIYNDRLCGEAKTAAADLVLYAKHLQDQGITEPIALVAGGETTVTVTGNGLGGRNQELALAFAIAAQRHGLSGAWAFLSAGTDGRDGPTDAAGAIVDPDSLQRMRNAGLNPCELLADNNAYHALSGAADLIISGATGTNVADLQVLLLQPNNPNSIHN
ncbi:MAG: MOFRL family protein, partial [Methylococcales bacterium]